MKKKLKIKKRRKKVDTKITELTINGETYVKKSDVSAAAKVIDGLKYVIVRSYAAGVCAGYLEKQSDDGKRVTLKKSRRLWYWKGAASLHQLANEGVKAPKECKFPAELSGLHEIVDACEVLDVTAKAQESINGVPIWSA